MLHISFFKILLEVIVKCLLPEGAMKGSFTLHLLPCAFWGERSMYIFRVADVNGADFININVLYSCNDVSNVYTPIISVQLVCGFERSGWDAVQETVYECASQCRNGYAK
jgi:hypothetical protein